MRNKIIRLFVVLSIFALGAKGQANHVGPITYTIAVERDVAPNPNYDLVDELYTLNSSGNIVGLVSSPYHTNDGTKMYDTFYVIQSQYTPAFVYRYTHYEGTNICYQCGYDGYQYYDEAYPYYDSLELVSIPLQFPSQDTTVGSVHVKIYPSTDNSYNLPSHDPIKLYIDNQSLTGITWEYSINNGVNWADITAAGNGVTAQFSAYDIFGTDIMNHLGQTILVRAKYSINYLDYGYTFITPFTIRLSSPHMRAVGIRDVNCFQEANGGLKIILDRNLLPGEKLNFLVKNQQTQVDYSMLNLTSANLSYNADPYGSTILVSGWTYSYWWWVVPYFSRYYTNIPGPHYYYDWPSELPIGDYTVSLLGKYNNINTYTGAPTHFGEAQLQEPPKQGFTTLQTSPVVCKGGNSGKAYVKAFGGVGNYKYGLRHQSETTYTWRNFTSLGLGVPTDMKNQIIDSLKAGTYYVKIRDANDCILRDSTGNELIKTLVITEPAQELQVDLLEVTPVTSYDSTNGGIRVRIKGGTRNPGEPAGSVYPYVRQWRDSATNTIITNDIVDTTGGKFESKLQHLPPGTYYFEAKDMYYDLYGSAYINDGCRVFLKVVLQRPDPLQSNISLLESITCKDAANGKLKVTALGGVPIDSIRYTYKWYKLISSSFQLLSATDSILTDVGIGQYKAEVKDKFNNVKMSQIFVVTEPSLITITTSATQSSCYTNADGTATALATGGTPPYRYEWSNSDVGTLMDSVPGGSYFILVRDSLGCESTKTVVITSPIQMQANITVVPVKCNNEANGKITVVPSGGTAPYQYVWSNGPTTLNNIQNISSGTYWVTTKDNNNCVRTDTINIVNPVKYAVTAGPDRVVCPSQTIPLTATILLDSGAVAPTLTYLWNGPAGFNPSTLQTVNTLKAGTYYLSATNTTGCVQKDTLIVTSSTSLGVPEFIVSTQAYVNESVLLANLSSPMPDSVRWQLPAGVTLVNSSRSFCELKFADTGRYSISIFDYYSSGCVYTKTKTVNVTSGTTLTGLGNQANAFLKLFKVYPNPTSGAFTVELVFNGITKARLRLINTLTNATIMDQIKEGQYSYTIPYNITGVPSTTYILIIETAKGNFVYKLIKA